MLTSPTMQRFVTEAAGQRGYGLESPDNWRLLLRRDGKGPLVIEAVARNVVAVSDFHDPEDGALDAAANEPFVSCEYFTGGDAWILTRVWPAYESLPLTFAIVSDDGSQIGEPSLAREQEESTVEMERTAGQWLAQGAGTVGVVEPSLG